MLILLCSYHILISINLFIDLFWTAPEILRNPKTLGSQKGDVYSFGIILYEIFSRMGVFCYCNMEPKG